MSTTNTTPRTPAEAARRILADEGPLIPLRSAARLLQVDERTVRRWAARGRLTPLKTTARRGGRLLIPRYELERLLVSMMANAPSEG
jgi:excisionase family DNA binding protein